jgi:hypothetical protein
MYILHPRQSVTGVTVIGRVILTGMAENAVSARLIVILREGVYPLGRRHACLVAKQAQLVSPVLVAFWIGLNTLRSMAQQTFGPPFRAMLDGQGRQTAPLMADAAALFFVFEVGGQRELSNLPLVVAIQTRSPPLNWVQDSRCRY